MEPRLLMWVLLAISCLAQAIVGLTKLLIAKNKKKEALQEAKEETTTITAGNPNGVPGKAQICIDNGKTLERLETQMKDVRGDIKDIFIRLNK